MVYIYFFQDGSVKKSTTVPGPDVDEAVENAEVTIVRTDGNIVQRYDPADMMDWSDIESVD